MNQAITSALLGLLMSVAACSNAQVYKGLQHRNEADCRQLPLARQQDCIDDLRGPDYDSYQRELKKAQ